MQNYYHVSCIYLYFLCNIKKCDKITITLENLGLVGILLEFFHKFLWAIINCNVLFCKK